MSILWKFFGIGGTAEQQYNRANAFRRSGNLKIALRHYTKAIELNPRLFRSYSNRGLTRGDLGDYHGALSDFTKAIELKPDNVKAYDNRGLAKFALDDCTGAIEDHSRAIEIDPKHSIAYFNRANVYFHLKNYQEAASDYSKVVDLNPSDRIARQKLDSARARQNESILSEMAAKGEIPKHLANVRALNLAIRDAFQHSDRTQVRKLIVELANTIRSVGTAGDVEAIDPVQRALADGAEAFANTGWPEAKQLVDAAIDSLRAIGGSLALTAINSGIRDSRPAVAEAFRRARQSF